jgi:hypothetical protein
MFHKLPQLLDRSNTVGDNSIDPAVELDLHLRSITVVLPLRKVRKPTFTFSLLLFPTPNDVTVSPADLMYLINRGQ